LSDLNNKESDYLIIMNELNSIFYNELDTNYYNINTKKFTKIQKIFKYLNQIKYKYFFFDYNLIFSNNYTDDITDETIKKHNIEFMNMFDNVDSQINNILYYIIIGVIILFFIILLIYIYNY